MSLSLLYGVFRFGFPFRCLLTVIRLQEIDGWSDKNHALKTAHTNIKKVVVGVAGDQEPGQKWRLTAEQIDSIPTHHRRTVLQSLQQLVVAYDNAAELDMSTIHDIIMNARALVQLAILVKVKSAVGSSGASSGGAGSAPISIAAAGSATATAAAGGGVVGMGTPSGLTSRTSVAFMSAAAAAAFTGTPTSAAATSATTPASAGLPMPRLRRSNTMTVPPRVSWRDKEPAPTAAASATATTTSTATPATAVSSNEPVISASTPEDALSAVIKAAFASAARSSPLAPVSPIPAAEELIGEGIGSAPATPFDVLPSPSPVATSSTVSGAAAAAGMSLLL